MKKNCLICLEEVWKTYDMGKAKAIMLCCGFPLPDGLMDTGRTLRICDGFPKDGESDRA